MRGEDGCTTLTSECKNQYLDYSLKLRKFKEMAVVSFLLGFMTSPVMCGWLCL